MTYVTRFLYDPPVTHFVGNYAADNAAMMAAEAVAQEWRDNHGRFHTRGDDDADNFTL